MNKNNFSILEYQSSNAPLFRENSNKLWIDCGADNLYPSYLEELYASSSMHGAIIKGVAEMIFGDGLNATNKDDHIEQWLKVKEIFGDEECLKKAAFDLKLYGQAFLNIIWSQDRTTISKVHHIPASTIRCGIADDEDNVPLFYHKTDWTEMNTKPHAIPAFSSTDRAAASQIIHVKNYTPLSFYYGLPDYLPCTNYAQVEADLSAYHLSSINQGFFPSTIMNFNSGVPTEDERAELERLVYQKFGGANNAGKILMTFNDSQDTAPTIESFNLSDAHQVFDYLSEQCSKKVLSGHRVTSPLLFGVRDTGGGFGNNADEMKDAYDLFYNTVILPFQRLLLDALKPVFAASSVTLDMYFTPLKPASFIDTDNLFDSNAPDSRKRDASYEGSQIESAMEIVAQVKQGILTVDQAKVFLVQMLQFTPEVADALFTEDSAIEQIEEEQDEQEATAQTQLKKKESTLKERMRSIDARLGEGYFYVRSEWVQDIEVDAKLHAKKHMFFEEYANPEIVEQDSYGDILSREGFVFAVRYMYEETAETPSQGGKSRDFCTEMMELSDEGVEYRYEDIVDMEGENQEFGHNGRPYSIWEHKGGIYCRHGWSRNIYIFAPDGEPKEMDMVEIEGAWEDVMRRVGNNPEVVQRGSEYVAPIDTPTRGAYR